MNFRSLVKKFIPTNLFRVIEPYGHWVEAILAQFYFGFPARKLKVIGVTGTDGKTSTCSFIAEILRDSGYKVAMMTTISIDYGDGEGPQPNPTRLTTIGAFPLAQKLKAIKSRGAEWLVLEATSHALAQHRVWGVPFDTAVITNLNHEHLDYHRTFANYRKAKGRLFEQCNANRKGRRVGVVNADDENAGYFTDRIANPITFGTVKGDLKATDIKLSPAGSSYKAVIANDSYNISINIPGKFNVYNSLAAICVGRAVGLDKDQIEKGIANLKSVEGRMTSVKEGQDFDVIVDYAHTPESFEKLFSEVRGFTKGRIIAVFGSAGRRDEEKRGEQGEIAGKLCDIVIATEEDDRDIDGMEILEQIAEGAVAAGKVKDKDLFLVHDREKAVEKAIDIAEAGDMILLLGKGHEKSILGSGPEAEKLRHLPQDDNDPRRVVKRDYDEVTVAREILKRKTKPS